MSDQDQSRETWKAPYLSYETLTNFFEKKLGGNPLPPRIDVHFLDNYAGSVRPLLISTLKTLGMIDEKNEVLETLGIAVKGPDERRAVMRSWAQEFYSEQLGLAERHATAQMLWETFSKHGYNGSTLRRAVIFYLALVDDTGLPNSTFFKAPKAPPSSGSRSSRKVPPVDQGSVVEADEGGAGQNPSGEHRVVELGGAGTVTMHVDVRWLDLPDETFAKLRQLIKDIEALAPKGTTESTPPPAEEGDDSAP